MRFLDPILDPVLVPGVKTTTVLYSTLSGNFLRGDEPPLSLSLCRRETGPWPRVGCVAPRDACIPPGMVRARRAAFRRPRSIVVLYRRFTSVAARFYHLMDQDDAAAGGTGGD